MILIINNHSGNINKIEKILKKYKQKYIIKEQSSLFKEMKNVKGIILTGGNLILDEKMIITKIRADASAILNYDVPILGICLGHEIIGELYGGEIAELKKPIVKEGHKVKILKKEHIFKNLPDEIGVYEYHSRYLKLAPNSFELSATSEKNKIEALFHKTKPIFTVQFHPEESYSVGEQIIKNFLDICKKY